MPTPARETNTTRAAMKEASDGLPADGLMAARQARTG
jgi:hypothetical protein